ncbi:MAG: acetate--CoA ligase family protein, partial [Hyphomicrobiales bacterium]
MAAAVNLDALLKPGSVAVLGASVRPSIGRSIIASLGMLGFPGTIYPVNPKYDEILGHPCYGSLEDLPAAPDVVAFCVGSTRILENFRRLPACGAGAAVIYDAGFAEAGEKGRERQDELVAICRRAGIALLGPNSMGCLSPWNRATTYLTRLRDPEGLAGNVGLISQSGSVCIGLLGDIRRFGFSHVISSGNEAVVTTADYIDYLVDDPETRVIATFTETVNAPEQYVAALDRAAAAGKPVVVLKVGRSERARRAITSHTGGLSGEAAVFSEVLRAHRAIEVHDLDEMTEVLAACQAVRWPRGPRLAVATGSGGHAELMLDLAARNGIELPALPPIQRAEIETVIGRLTGDGNPTDFWGNGDHRTNLSHCLKVLREGAAYDALVLCMDSHDHDPMAAEAMYDCVGLLRDSAAQSELPHYLMGTRPGILDTGLVGKLAEAGLATLGGTHQGLLALDRLARWVGWRRRERAPTAGGKPVLAGLLAGTPGRRTINEFDTKRALAASGLPTVPEWWATSLDEALLAAEETGYPVVLKAAGDDLAHKTEHGLVRLDLREARELDMAWKDLQDTCG